MLTGRALPYLLAILLLVSASPGAMAEDSPVSTRRILIGLNYGWPHFTMDHTVDGGSAIYHFFTSRPTEYLGWQFRLTSLKPVSRRFAFGYMLGIGIWKAEYRLNREVPAAQVSGDPFDARLGAGYMDAGVMASVRAGPWSLSPFVVVPFGLSNLLLTYQNEESGNSALYLGLAGGVETHWDLSETVGVMIGYRTTWLVEREPEYDVAGVVLKGRFSKRPEEIYAGATFRLPH